jgi:uncharacterized membrane protein YhaH (DUF805 family)
VSGYKQVFAALLAAARRHTRAIAVLLTAVAVLQAAAVAGLLAFVPWAVAHEQRFVDAPVCGVYTIVNCRSLQTEQVWRVIDGTGKYPIVEVDVAVPGTPGFGQSVLLQGGPLGSRLRPGDTVDVIGWQGQPVVVRSGHLRQDTLTQPANYQTPVLEFLSTLVLLLPATALTARRLWRRQEWWQARDTALVLAVGAVIAFLAMAWWGPVANIYANAAFDGVLVAAPCGWLLRQRIRRRAGRPAAYNSALLAAVLPVGIPFVCAELSRLPFTGF